MKTFFARRTGFEACLPAMSAGAAVAVVVLTGCNAGLEQGQNQKHQNRGQGIVEDVSIQLLTDQTRVLQKEADLQASAKSLADQHTKLEQERAWAEDKLSSISQADKASRQKAEQVQANIAEQERLLRVRAAQIEASRAQLDRDKTALLNRAIKPFAPLPAGKGDKDDKDDKLNDDGTASSDTPQTLFRGRQEALARREALLAVREERIAEREATSSQSMGELKALLEALRLEVRALKDAPAPQMPPTSHSPDSSVTGAQLQRAIKAIHQSMGSKGILIEDLPQGLHGFDKAAAQAGASRDLTAVMALCDKVLQTVDATPINHGFVEGKMARINRTLGAKSIKLDASGQKKIQELLAEATDAFSDGRYDRANRKINQICALLPGPEAR